MKSEGCWSWTDLELLLVLDSLGAVALWPHSVVYSYSCLKYFGFSGFEAIFSEILSHIFTYFNLHRFLPPCLNQDTGTNT